MSGLDISGLLCCLDVVIILGIVFASSDPKAGIIRNCLFVTVGKSTFSLSSNAMRIMFWFNLIRLVSLLFGEGGLKRRSSFRERVEWTRASREVGYRAARQGLVYQERLKIIGLFTV